MQHIFNFPLPPTLNEQIREARSHWAISAQTKSEWTGIIAIASCNAPNFPGQVWMDFIWGIPRFSRDPDNIWSSAKYIFDGLSDAGIIRNDNLTVIQSPVMHWYEKDKTPSVMVTIADNPNFLFERMEIFKDLYSAQAS